MNKKIVINPELFKMDKNNKGSSTKPRKNKNRTQKNKRSRDSEIRKLKKNLLRTIKRQQLENELLSQHIENTPQPNLISQTDNIQDGGSRSNYNNSMEYINSIVKRSIEKRNLKQQQLREKMLNNRNQNIPQVQHYQKHNQQRQPITQPITQPIPQPIQQPIPQPITQPIQQPITQPIVVPEKQDPQPTTSIQDNISMTNLMFGNNTTINKVQDNKQPEINIQVDSSREGNYNEKINENKQNNINPLIKEEPKYGCLKGGSKPTFRELKNQTRKNRLDEIKNKRMNENNDKKQRRRKTLVKKYKIKNRKRTYKLGKDKNKKKVYVLVKNKRTRKQINDELNKIKRQNIHIIKKYLRERNYIKFGTNAPEYLLRHMYKQCLLSGDTKNLSSDVLMHNYMNGENDLEL